MPTDMSGNIRYMLPVYVMASLIAVASINAVVLFATHQVVHGMLPLAAAAFGTILLDYTLGAEIWHRVRWLANDVPAACAYLRNKVD